MSWTDDEAETIRVAVDEPKDGAWESEYVGPASEFEEKEGSTETQAGLSDSTPCADYSDSSSEADDEYFRGKGLSRYSELDAASTGVLIYSDGLARTVGEAWNMVEEDFETYGPGQAGALYDQRLGAFPGCPSGNPKNPGSISLPVRPARRVKLAWPEDRK
jgi:hypothetical protein